MGHDPLFLYGRGLGRNVLGSWSQDGWISIAMELVKLIYPSCTKENGTEMLTLGGTVPCIMAREATYGKNSRNTVSRHEWGASELAVAPQQASSSDLPVNQPATGVLTLQHISGHSLTCLISSYLESTVLARKHDR